MNQPWNNYLAFPAVDNIVGKFDSDSFVSP